MAIKTELKVGVFSLTALAVIGYMFFFLSPDFFFGGQKKNYYTLVSNASGIVPKTYVKTNGVNVGKVDKVVLEGKKTKILFEVDDDLKIPEGSKIVIKEKGLLGDVFLEILRSDDEEGPSLPSGAYIPPDENHFSLSSLISMVGSVGADVKKITNAVSSVIGSEDSIIKLKTILSDVQSSTAGIRSMLDENRKDLRDMVLNLKQLTQTLNSPDIKHILQNVKKTSEDVKALAENGRKILDGDNPEKIQHILASLEETSQSIKQISEKVQKGEGTIGKLFNDDQTIKEIQSAISDVRSILKPATQLQVHVDYRGEYLKDQTTRNHANLIFRTKPETFYLLGFTDADSAQEDEIVETISTSKDPGSPDQVDGTTMIKTRKRSTNKGAVRFNLQYGKRFGPLQVRFGLFETTGGLGLDYKLFDDQVVLTAEAYDWDQKSYIRKTAHVKTYLSLVLFRYFSITGGVHDWTILDQATKKVRTSPMWFLGGGVHFQDDDLKALFGSMALFR